MAQKSAGPVGGHKAGLLMGVRSLAWALQGLPGDLEKAGSSQHLGTFGDSS